MTIHSSTEVNRSATVMSCSGSVDESCRDRRIIARHSIDAVFSFFNPDASRFYHLAQIGMNRDCVTGALDLLLNPSCMLIVIISTVLMYE